MDDCPNTQNAKVPFDPGWNDPPTLSYNSQQQTTAGRPRNFLNKRVAFPLTGNSSPPAINMPPKATAGLPNAPPTLCNLPLTTKKEEFTVDSENLLKEVKEILLEFLNNSSELGPKSNDIKKRISVMEEMWSNGKLNNAIKLKMQELACALRDDEPSKADDIHRALMVDYVSIVGTWMPGVKQLVHHCIARAELLAIDKET